MTSFCCLQVSFIRSCGKYSPNNFDIKNIDLYNIIMMFRSKDFRTLRLLEERVMASPEPSRRPSTLHSTTLLSTEMWANTTCHIFGAKFCLPPQNSKLNNIPLHLNICAIEVKHQLATNIQANMAQ